jgi:hypothetical protein
MEDVSALTGLTNIIIIIIMSRSHAAIGATLHY